MDLASPASVARWLNARAERVIWTEARAAQLIKTLDVIYEAIRSGGFDLTALDPDALDPDALERGSRKSDIGPPPSPTSGTSP